MHTHTHTHSHAAPNNQRNNTLHMNFKKKQQQPASVCVRVHCQGSVSKAANNT